MGILAIITARKGSKGLACKNFRKIGGVSLTDCAVHKAVELKKRGLIDEIYVSSDSLFLCEQASVITGERYELRCAELSADSVKSIDVVENVLDLFRQKGRSFSDVLIMQPTSPLCSVEDYSEAIGLYQNGKTESLISVCHMDGVNPNGLYFVDKNHVATPLLNTHGSGTRRQDLPELYLRNGAIFMVNVSYMTTHKRLISDMPLCYVMPAERSINIDSYDDLDRADLERLAYRVVLAYVLFRIFRYDKPFARHGLDEPLALEHTQRFAHRHTAHAELLRYLSFNQPLAARYVSVKYPLAQKICDLSAKRAPLRQFQARVYSYRHTVTLPTPYACL